MKPIQYIGIGLLGLTLLTACGGGGGTPTPTPDPSDTVAPVADTFTPADGSTGVEPGTTVSAMFDEEMNAATITTSSFTLETASSTAVTSTVNYDSTNDTVTLTPSNGLALLTNYIANLKATITDLAGNPLADTSWQFTTRDGSWQGVEGIEMDDNMTFTPQITMDAGGNGIAVWTQLDGVFMNVLASRYVHGTGWEVAENIGTNIGTMPYPQIGMDAGGNAIAVWVQPDGINLNIWASRYVPGTGWLTAKKIGANTGEAAFPQISMDSGGNAIAVWVQHDGTNPNIWASRYVPGTGWLTAEKIGANTGEAEFPQVCIGTDGNAIAVWSQPGSVPPNIWASRYVPGTGWLTAEKIGANTGEAAFPQISMDSDGNAIAVWVQPDGTNPNIWANRYTAATGWKTAEKIGENTGEAEFPQIAMDVSGNALVVWSQPDNVIPSIWAKRYVPGTGWKTAETVGTNTGVANLPQIGMDANGNAIAVWSEIGIMGYNIWANRYKSGIGWESADLIEDDTGNAGYGFLHNNPQVFTNANGYSIAVWGQDSNISHDIRSNSFE